VVPENIQLKMTEAKRHHYLPKSYLERFCENNDVFVYDRKMKEIRSQTPINTALQSQYYSSVNEKGEKNPEIETQLLSKIDGDGNIVIKKLLNHEQIDKFDIEKLSIFLGFMMHRTPYFEDSYNSLSSHLLRQLLDPIFSNDKNIELIMDKNENNFTAKEMADFHNENKGNLKITPHRNDSLKFMLERSLPFAEMFMQMDFNILYCSKELSVITSDNPVFTTTKINQETNNVIGKITLFPLSHNHCLNLSEKKRNYINYVEIKQDNVDYINKEVALNSYRFIFGKSEKILKKIVLENKIKDMKPRKKFYCGE